MRALIVSTNRFRDLLPPPPVGASYVASAAAAAGHEIQLIDQLGLRDPPGALLRAIEDFRPSLIAFSIRNLDNLIKYGNRQHLLPLAKEIAELRTKTDLPIVAGGGAVTVIGPTALDALPIDYAILGEGEASFVALLDSLSGKRPLTDVPGLAYRSNGHILSNPPRLLHTFHASGMQRFVDWRRYERFGSTWAIQTKRGCPMPCSYCPYGSMEGYGYRLRPPEDVVDEIEEVRRTAHPRTFEFVDSTFNLPLDHTLAVCDAIGKRERRSAFTAQGVNPATAGPQLFRTMERIGFNSFMVSPEAGNDRILDSLCKGFTMDDVHRTRDAARDSSMVSLWFFMLGAPGETRETVEETISFAERYLDWERCVAVINTGVRILPGTGIEQTAIAQGVIRPDRDLAAPAFYFSPEVAEDWVLERINRAVARRSTIVHAGEESNLLQKIMGAILYHMRVPPPHWRFLPRALRSRPLREVRKRFPDIGPKPRD